MRLRVVSWNVDSRPTGLLDAKVDLLRRLRPDIALLQEISRSVYRALLPHPSAHERMHRQSRLFSWGALSTDLSTPRGSEYRLGCAVLGVSTTAPLDARVLDQAPFGVSEPVRPGFRWRTMAAQVALATGELLTAGSFHGRQSADLDEDTGSPEADLPAADPPAADPPAGGPPAGGPAAGGPAAAAAALRQAFHTGIAGWLAGVSGPVVFGIDSAVPVGDADPLLGPEPGHELRGVLRATHDHLWVTRHLEVLDVQCLADDATAAGSDHPLLLADLELRGTASSPG